MATESQIKANRRNAQKSTGPTIAEGKAVVSQNAVKHGLFAHENVIKCEKQVDFDRFRDELLAGLKPVGGVEAMMAERIVSLSWRLKRVERMNSEVIDVKIARIEAGSWDRSARREAGLLDSETGRSELALGWAIMRDFSDAQVLERLLMYEKRIESSLYKAIDELQKLQQLRKKEQAEATVAVQGRDALAAEAATHSEDQTDQNKKQSQFTLALMSVNPFIRKDYENDARSGSQGNKPDRSQYPTSSRPEDVRKGEKMTSGASHRC